jgi:AraC-like DNA-binding protein
MKRNTSKPASLRLYTIQEFILASGSKHGKEFNISSGENLRIEPEISMPFRLNHFVILLVTKGTVRMRLNLVDYDIHANSLVVCSPDVIYEFLSDVKICSFIVTNFSAKLLAEAALNRKYIEGFGFFMRQYAPIRELSPGEVQNILIIMEQLIAKNKLPGSYPFISELLLNSFKVLFFEIASILYKQINTKNIILNSKEDLVKRFYAEMSMHFKLRREVEFYAEKLHVTPKYLTKCVKEIVGKSTSEIITQMVIVEAKIKLNNISDPISKIAEELSFSDQFFFSKYFKRASGISPSEYRSQLSI